MKAPIRITHIAMILIGFVHLTAQSQTIYYYKGTGALTSTSSWAINPNGTGASPSNFRGSDIIYQIRNTTSVTLTANWTISGNNSKLVLGDPSQPAVNFIHSSGDLNCLLDIEVALSGGNVYTEMVANDSRQPDLGKLAAGSIVEYARDGSQNVNLGTYSNLYIKGTGTKTATDNIQVTGRIDIGQGLIFSMSTFALTGTFTTSGTGSFRTQNTSSQPVPSGIDWNWLFLYNSTSAQTIAAGSYTDLNATGGNRTFATSGVVSISGLFTKGAGTYNFANSTVEFDGASAQILPSAFTFNNLTLSGSGIKSLSGALTVNGILQFNTPAQLSIGSNTLTLNGTLSGSSSFIGSSSSNLTIGGGGAFGSAIFMDQTNAANRSLNSIILNRATTNVSLGNRLELLSSITLTNGTLTSNGYLVLVSNNTSTARVAPITGTGVLSGNVIVQRYIPSIGRRWRFLSSPVSNTNLEDWRNEIFVTGNNLPSANQSQTLGQKNWGFDATNSNQASVFFYDETVLGNVNAGYVDVKNNASTLSGIRLIPGRGYRVFIRGDRSDLNRLTNANTSQNEVTLDLVGTINSGDFTIPVTFTSSGNTNDDGWNLVGNPYPSAYDWNAFWDAGNSGFNPNLYRNIDPTVYVFDASTNSWKSYNAQSNSGTITGGIIASGQSFFVKASGANPMMVMREQYKSSGTPVMMFKTNSVTTDELRLELKLDSVNKDECIIKLVTAASNIHDAYDIVKMQNPTVNVSSFGSDSIFHTLDCRPLLTNRNDTIRLSVIGVSGSFTFTCNALPAVKNKYFYLVDAFNSNLILLDNSKSYNFLVDAANPLTYGNDRFYIIVTDKATLPVSFNYFQANADSHHKPELRWATSSEKNSSVFLVEKSDDGKVFYSVGSVAAKGNSEEVNEYVYIDETTDLFYLKNGFVYYRLKQIDIDGQYSYTNIVSLSNIGSVEKSNSYKLYPNPSEGRFTIDGIESIKKIEISNACGNLVYKADGILNKYEIEGLGMGIYLVTIEDTHGIITRLKAIVK